MRYILAVIILTAFIAVRALGGESPSLSRSLDRFKQLTKRGKFVTYELKKAHPVTTYDELIHEESAKKNLDPALVKALIWVESAWKTDAVGSSGEEGLGQLMPATAREFGVRDSFNPEQNIKGSIAYLAWCRGVAGEYALRCYNGGPKWHEKKKSVRDAVKIYEAKVLGKLRRSG